MRKFLLITILLMLAFNVKGKARGTEGDSLEFAKLLLEAIKSEDINKIIALNPTPEVIRKIAPDATKDKSDKEIQEMISSNEKFKQDFENVLESARKHKINLENLVLESSKIEKVWEGENKPLGMIIGLRYNNETCELALSVIEFEKKLYFMEFLISTDVFESLSKK